MVKLKKWLKNRWKELEIGDPNSAEGLRERAKRLIKEGYAIDSPYVSVLVKQALLKEKRGHEIPEPDVWDLMSDEEREEWVLKQLGERTW